MSISTKNGRICYVTKMTLKDSGVEDLFYYCLLERELVFWGQDLEGTVSCPSSECEAGCNVQRRQETEKDRALGIGAGVRVSPAHQLSAVSQAEPRLLCPGHTETLLRAKQASEVSHKGSAHPRLIPSPCR